MDSQHSAYRPVVYINVVNNDLSVIRHFKPGKREGGEREERVRREGGERERKKKKTKEKKKEKKKK